MCFVLLRPIFKFLITNKISDRSQWPRDLRLGSAAVRLLELRVRIPPATWMSVSCECCVSSVIGLCDGSITRPEESYRVWCVWVCDREASTVRRTWPARGYGAMKEKPPIYLQSKLNSYEDYDAKMMVFLQFYVLYMFSMMRYAYTAQVHPWADSQAKSYGSECAM